MNDIDYINFARDFFEFKIDLKDGEKVTVQPVFIAKPGFNVSAAVFDISKSLNGVSSGHCCRLSVEDAALLSATVEEHYKEKGKVLYTALDQSLKIARAICAAKTSVVDCKAKGLKVEEREAP